MSRKCSGCEGAIFSETALVICPVNRSQNRTTTGGINGRYVEMPESCYEQAMQSENLIQSEVAAPSRYRPGPVKDLILLARSYRLAFLPRGRSRRTELLVVLFYPQAILALVLIPLLIFGLIDDEFPSNLLAICAILIPMPALAARRLHDRGESGWLALPVLGLCLLSIWESLADWLNGPFDNYSLFGDFWQLSAIMTAIVLLYLVLLLGSPDDGENQFGPDPRE
ncbi:DUF805 domain-containing protein [Alteraurantiacibacter aestuarii]|uniref:DUF805 domain-containing protein n=1 Tax=Alteraurantiacibacter aestuarii TaxID=650004 RepID=UPI0031D3D6A8